MEQIHGGNIYELKRNGKEVTDFSANINPLGMPEGIKDAVQKAIDDSFRYPDIKSGELLRALSSYEQLPSENIVIGNGAADLIYALCFYKKFHRALIMSPTFSEYEKALKASDSEIVKMPLTQENDFKLTDEHIELIDKSIDAVFICQPNNPTGILTEREMLLKLFNKCRENDVFIVIDECFLEFIEDADSYSLKALLNEGGIFILKSFTKLYAMAGIRLGYAMCGDIEIIKGVNSCRQPWSVSNLAESAGVAALKETRFVEKSLDYIRKEKSFILENFRKLDLEVYGSSANYIFFYSDEFELYEKLLHKGILIRSCKSYETIPEGFYRVAVRSHEENIKLIESLKEVLRGE